MNEEVPQVPGPDDGPLADQGSAPGAPVEGDPAEGVPGTYRNLWVPLIVVPAAVVGVLVLVFVLFSSIAGREASPEENLQRMVQGGSNERQQAAFNLVRQVRAAAEGHEEGWAPTPAFLSSVRSSWNEVAEDDHASRMVLAMILAQNGDAEALPKLVELIQLGDEADPEGKIRFNALAGLSSLGDPSVVPYVAPLLDHEDHVLRLGAASVLQSIPGPASVAALTGALDDSSLEVRGMAAISLSILGDAGGAHVLVDLTDASTYETEHSADPRRFAHPLLIQHTRVKAVEALARLGRPQDRERIVELASSSEPDLVVREAAKRALTNFGG